MKRKTKLGQQYWTIKWHNLFGEENAHTEFHSTNCTHPPS